ncbi:hypothetical protein ABEB22_21125 (plasmid) [Thioclava sp. 'Guangxiensis']|uniref:hypothetical protein n=1 Tax=Thioclava sp. 'Guangxiensis' TaxID=3149044 RepID=UPI00387812EA
MSYLKSAALAAALTLGTAFGGHAATIYDETTSGTDLFTFGGSTLTAFSFDVPVSGDYLFEVSAPSEDMISVLYSFGTSGTTSYAAYNSGTSFVATLTANVDSAVDYLLAIYVDGIVSSISLTVSEVPAVPLPAGLPLLAGALALGGIVARRRKTGTADTDLAVPGMV